MTDNSYTHLALVIDRSGSMIAIREDMEGAIKQLLEEQVKEPGKILVDITLFDSKIEALLTNAKPEDIHTKGLIKPRGSTALIDAVGTSSQALGERLAELPENERPGHVIVAVVTDGQENSSTEWSQVAVRELIKTQTDEYSWDYIFLGANIDSAKVGAGFGIAAAQTMDYAPTTMGVAHAGSTISGYVTSTRSGLKTTLKQESTSR